MSRVDKIKAGFSGLVGFRNGLIDDYDIVDSDNQTSSSGLFYQDASPIVSIRNIKDCQEYGNISDEQFNDLLERMQESVSLEVFNKVFNSQACFIYSNNLFPFEKTFENLLSKTGKFVYFEINPSLGDRICKIPYVELSFDEDVTFNLYLYNSNKPSTPIETKEVVASAGASKVVDLQWYIDDDSEYKGGTYYLGYFEGDLGTASAYARDYESSNFRVQTPHYYVQVGKMDYSGTTIDVSNTTVESDSFGLNIGMEVYNDYIQLSLRNKDLFNEAIQMQMHEKVLLMVLASTRSNSTERDMKQLAVDSRVELYGHKESGIVGVQQKLKDKIDSIRKIIFPNPRISRATLRT